MPVLKDRIKDTTTTTGTGTLTLSGAAPTGFRSFADYPDGVPGVPYVVGVVDANGAFTGQWECGLGTVGGGGTTLARTTVTRNNSGGSTAVNFGAGTKHVYSDRIANFSSLPQPLDVTDDPTFHTLTLTGDLAVSGTAQVGGLTFLGAGAIATLDGDITLNPFSGTVLPASDLGVSLGLETQRFNYGFIDTVWATTLQNLSQSMIVNFNSGSISSTDDSHGLTIQYTGASSLGISSNTEIDLNTPHVIVSGDVSASSFTAPGTDAVYLHGATGVVIDADTGDWLASVTDGKWSAHRGAAQIELTNTGGFSLLGNAGQLSVDGGDINIETTTSGAIALTPASGTVTVTGSVAASSFTASGAVKGDLQTNANATTGLLAGALAATTTATLVITDGTGQAYRVPCII